MFQLPKPILGEISAFTITVPDLEASLHFYEKLGFRELFRADWPFPWIQITDGAVLIMLRKAPQTYIALTYYVKDIATVVADLEMKHISFSFRSEPQDMVQRFVFQTPEGFNVSLVSLMEGFRQQEGPTMLQMPPSEYTNPDKYVNKICGMYGEYALPVPDLESALSFWALLGFTAVSKFGGTSPWAIISDGLSIVGLHQTTKFTSPAITFFAVDSQTKISQLQASGLEGITLQSPSNAVISTPEGQYINLFHLGM